MEQVNINFKPVLEQIAHKFHNLTELKENKRKLKLHKRSKMMSGFIDLATFDDLQKIEDKIEDVIDIIEETVEEVVETIEETVAEIIVAAEPIIMTVIEPMIVAEVISMVAPNLVLAPILAPVISLAAWEADQKLKATLQALIEKSKKKVVKKKA